MSNLIVLGFDGLHTADEVLNKLRSLQKEYLIDLEDACVVERDATGRIHIKQAVNLAAVGAKTGGASGGALSGSLADYGISDDFVRKLGETIPQGSSALFILFKSATEDKVLREIEPYRPRILKTSLSDEAERRLRTELTKAAA